MIPEGGQFIRDAEVEEKQQPSLTWKLDFKNNRITGKIDGLEAVRQAVFTILQTNRYEYFIYSFNHGNELESLIGKNPLYVRSEAKRMIKEALSRDDRIKGIENVQTEIIADSILIRFSVITDFGSFDEEVSWRV